MFFLYYYIILLRAELTCTNKSSQIGRIISAIWLVSQKDNEEGQNVFFPFFAYGSKSLYVNQNDLVQDYSARVRCLKI